MAENKNSSRAAKAVSNAKKTTTEKKTSAGKTAAQKAASGSGKKTPAKKNPPVVKTEYDRPRMPANVVTAIISLLLLVVFVFISVKPDGALLKFVQSVVLGLIGQAGFYFSIPALLYLFIINTFGRKNAVTMRSVCVVVFVFLCGCIYHLAVQTQGIATGLAVIVDLYIGGIEGITGGVLCGGVAMLIRWACGTPLSFVVCILAAVLTLLGAMQITIPSIIRAIANRPRDDFDEDYDAPYVEPAAVVVNHIANKKIEQKRQRRQRMELPEPPTPQESAPAPQAAKQKKLPKAQQPKEDVLPPAQPEPVSSGAPSKAKGIMSTIGLDSDAPLTGTATFASDSSSNEFDAEFGVKPVLVSAEDFDDPIPEAMPELKLDAKIPELVAQKDMSKLPVQKPAAKMPTKEPEQKPGKVTAKEAEKSAMQVAAEIAQNQAQQKPLYCFPPIDLLRRPMKGGVDGTEEMRENSRRLNETLASFNIDAHIINVTRGPSVTRYEVELDKGVRLNKLTGCADDIALSLGASGVRIAAVPGKISVVGIEVPNRAVTTVSLREVIDSQEFNKAKSLSSIALGKSIEGSCVVGNIAKMPHLLIAGTTGSGKSVCMNSIIISLLYKAAPEDVKLIMVDPKMVELGIYNGIPHLLIPVVTDPKKAAGSLQWAVTEMLRRYKMMSDLGVRDLESYNSIVLAEEDGQKLPQVVIIIDELADLMMVAAKEVEDSICRIAQMGRAAGMHLIIATQRPSANVITGLMKANIPSRIAFSVASAMESRIILDTMGAEKLVGKGDMLYAPIGSGKPLRVQGCFVTDSEVEAVAGYVKENYNAEYNQQVLDEIEKSAQQTGKKTASVSEIDASDEELEGDELLPDAVDVILETGQASVSMLQRRLKLGYARAARIVDEMEEKGIVGPFQGSKPRAILITKDQWAAMKSGQPQQMGFDDLEEDMGLPEDIY